MYPTYDANYPGLDFDPCMGDSSFVYLLVDPTDGTVRYVGQTRNPQIRCAQHQTKEPDKMKGSSALRRWKTSLRERGLRPVFRLVDSAPAERVDFMERRWITYYRSLGKLLNVEDGGQDGKGAGGRQAKPRQAWAPKHQHKKVPGRADGVPKWRARAWWLGTDQKSV